MSKPGTPRKGQVFVCNMSPRTGPSNSRLTPRESSVSRSIHASKSAESKRIINLQPTPSTSRTPPRRVATGKPPRAALFTPKHNQTPQKPQPSLERVESNQPVTPVEDTSTTPGGGAFATPQVKQPGRTPGKTSGTTPKRPTANSRNTPTKNATPVKGDERMLFQFNEDILVTPREEGATPSGRSTPTTTFTVSSRSFVHVDTPRPMPRHNPPTSSGHRGPRQPSSSVKFNRSHSASLIVRGKGDVVPSSAPPSSNGRNGIKRSCSEAKLLSDETQVLSGSRMHSAEDLAVETTRLTVGVRVRPLQPREHGNAVFVRGNEVSVASDLGSVHSFNYDHCFASWVGSFGGADAPSPATQEDVYRTMAQPLLDNAFMGYNACLLAYGQTGSGKTYSMMGPTTGEDDGIYPETGVIPRFCRELLERCQRVEEETEGGSVREGFNGKKRAITSTVEVSYLEVYNEKIHDLLVAGTQCVPLKVREHPIYGPYVVDLSKHTVNSFKEMQHWLNEGNKKRATAATELNDKSSRSHSLFIIVLTQTFMVEESDGTWTHEQTRTSSINLVDLAGSERIAHYSISNDRLREGVSINRSLLTLGKVITCLVEKRNFVPYRDSVLTRLLKESLGGNSRTAMLATVSPCSSHLDETLATLRYASQASSIVNRVRVNEAPQDKIIRELRAEVDRLKRLHMEDDRSRLEAALTSSPLRIILTPSKMRNREEDQRVSRMEAELEAARESVACLEVELATKQRRLDEANRETADLALIERELEALRQTLAETKNQLQERDTKFREAQDVLRELEMKKDCVEKELAALQGLEAENRMLTQEVELKRKEHRSEVERLNAELKAKEKQLVELREKYTATLIQLESANRELKSTKALLERSDSTRAVLKTELSACFETIKEWQQETNRTLQLSIQDFVTKTVDTVKNNETIKVEEYRYKEMLDENRRIKEELKTANESLKKKSVTVEKLKKKVNTLEEYLNNEINNINISSKRKEKTSVDGNGVSAQQDLKMYEIVMETAYPYHWEHLLRKARTYAEKYNIPYDFELSEASVTVKHLMFTAKTSWHRIFFTKWIENIEAENKWTKEMDKEVRWEVDFGDYYNTANPQPCRQEDLSYPNHPESAINLGTEVTRNGCICPRTWRKTMVRRHVLGLKEDASALTKHFAQAGDCRVTVVLNRMHALIGRLEVATELMEP